MENDMETTIIYRDDIGLYWGYIGIMENQMETTIMGYIEIIGQVNLTA